MKQAMTTPLINPTAMQTAIQIPTATAIERPVLAPASSAFFMYSVMRIAERLAEAIIERSMPPTSIGSIMASVNSPISGACFATEENELTEKNEGFSAVKSRMLTSVSASSSQLLKFFRNCVFKRCLFIRPFLLSAPWPAGKGRASR